MQVTVTGERGCC